MPRFYFTVRSLHGTVRDKKGIELIDEAAARQYAERIIARLKDNNLFRDGGFDVAVADDNAELFILPFEGAHLH